MSIRAGGLSVLGEQPHHVSDQPHPLSPNRRPAARAAEAAKPARHMLREPARRALYPCFSGILHSSTKPSTNSTAMDSTPNDELPDSWVKKLTRNVPMTAAYLPKMSKKP